MVLHHEVNNKIEWLCCAVLMGPHKGNKNLFAVHIKKSVQIYAMLEFAHFY